MKIYNIWTSLLKKAILLLSLMHACLRLNQYYRLRFGGEPYFFASQRRRTLGPDFLTGRNLEAIGALKRVLNRNPNFWPAHIYLAASYLELGQMDKARAEAAQILRTNPSFSLESGGRRLPYKDQAIIERLGESLSEAGLK